MRDTLNLPSTIVGAARRLLVAATAYAVGVAIVSSCLLPTLLSTDPVARLVSTEAATAVARLPQAAAPHTLARTP